jgi:hypothetical protein
MRGAQFLIEYPEYGIIVSAILILWFVRKIIKQSRIDGLTKLERILGRLAILTLMFSYLALSTYLMMKKYN